MFETLLIYPAVLARHQTGPGSAERRRYLGHCAGQGLARGRRRARYRKDTRALARPARPDGLPSHTIAV
jgi:hypothetical protein